MFLKAGGANPLTLKECEKALAACGYEPGDFGSYKEVLTTCGNARAQTGEAKSKGVVAPVDPKRDATGHERWVAEGQSGHISENTRHQATRGDNSTSFCPLYDTDEAPCMPHAGKAYHKDSQHGAVTNTDIRNGNAAVAGQEGDGRADRKPIGAKQERQNTKDVIGAALDWGIKDNQPAAAQMREKRFAAIAELNTKDEQIAKAAAKGKDARDKAIKEKYEKERQTAIDCVEGFFEYQWRKMANKTKAKKKQAADDAKKNEAAAQAKIDKLEKQSPKSEKDKEDLAKARKDLKAAQDAPAEYKKVENIDPDDTDNCLGQSRAPNPRGEFGKPTPASRSTRERE